MKSYSRFFRMVFCLALALTLAGIFPAAFSETGGTEARALAEADITGDGVPERMELYESADGKVSVRAFLVTEAGSIELILDRELASDCLLVFADMLRDSDKKLAAACYAAALDPDAAEADPEEEMKQAPVTTPAPEPIRAGTRFAFGRFEQNTFKADGPDPIIWRVLDTDEVTGNVLVLSEFGLITKQYHPRNSMTKWGDSSVRTWLNGVFLNSFTEEELALIVPTQVSGSTDTVFMLSAEEIRRYMREPYLCYATLWGLANEELEGAYVNKDTGSSSWLVRVDATDKLIPIVGGAGKLYVPGEGVRVTNSMTTRDNVVRPAMWVRREAIGEEVTQYGFSDYAKAKMDISTRSGPTTGYNGLGDYRIKGQWVHVLSKVNDGSIWWLQVEFDYHSELIRCYTGLKRVDIQISSVPEEPRAPLGTGTVTQAAEAYYGPGTMYKCQVDKYQPPVGTAGSIIARENGWVFLEYEIPECRVRVWLPEEAVTAD